MLANSRHTSFDARCKYTATRRETFQSSRLRFVELVNYRMSCGMVCNEYRAQSIDATTTYVHVHLSLFVCVCVCVCVYVCVQFGFDKQVSQLLGTVR
jgi:hypothetical protein